MPDFSGEDFPDRVLGERWLEVQRRNRQVGGAAMAQPTEVGAQPSFVQVSRNVVVHEGVGLGNETYHRVASPLLSGETIVSL